MSWLHPAVASAKRNHVDDIFFSFADAVLLNWNCVERPGPCWSRIDRPSTTVSPPSWPAYSRSRRTTMAAELLDVHGLILVIIFHVCTHSFFFCCLLVISSSIRKTFSRARVEERERSLFFLYFCCVLTAECLDGHGRMTSRRIQPSHTHGSSWWCLCLRHLFSMEEKSQPPSKSIFSYSV